MRVGVVGAGRHANAALYPALIESGFDLVAVTARSPERSAEAARRWGADRSYSSIDQMLDTESLDGVVVAVPADTYLPIVARCIQAGIPVFCEKPAAQSAKQLMQLDRLASTAGVEVVVGYMKRFAPAYERARELIEDPSFGTPSLAHFTFAMGQIESYLDDVRYYLIDNPVHMIDLARHLVGELADISAVVNVVADFGVSISVIARSELGAACSFDFCTTAAFEHRGEYVEVYGRGNAVQIENVDTCIHRPIGAPAQITRPNYTLPIPANSSLVTMGFVPALEHFRDVIAGKSANRSSLESAARTLLTMELLWGEVQPSLDRAHTQ